MNPPSSIDTMGSRYIERAICTMHCTCTKLTALISLSNLKTRCSHTHRYSNNNSDSTPTIATSHTNLGKQISAITFYHFFTPSFRLICTSVARLLKTPALAAIVFAIILAGCNLPTFTDRSTNAPATSPNSTSPDQTTQNPQAVVEQLYADLEEHSELYFNAIQAAADLANAHQSLGLAFLEYEMYGLASEHFAEALNIESHNEILHYYAGLAAANHSTVYPDGTQHHALQQQALHHYQTSIALNANYAEPRYALAVLYLYELEQPTEALQTLDALTMVQPTQATHLILYGYAHTILGNYTQAIQYYVDAKQLITSDAEQRDLQHNIDSLKSLIDG